MPISIDVYVGSDHAGCPITRKTTRGFSANFGEHVVKTESQIHSTISLSSGESELYHLVKGAAVELSVQSLLKSWGIEVKLNIYRDCSAVSSFSNRRGLGKQRHVQTRCLWIQERFAKKHISIHKIAGTDNRSDIMTKAFSKPLLHKRLKKIHFVFRDGNAEKQKQAVAQIRKEPVEPHSTTLGNKHRKPLRRLCEDSAKLKQS